jgi:hypothetical protein
MPQTVALLWASSRHALEDHIFGCRRVISKVQSVVEIDGWVLDPFLVHAIEALRQYGAWLISLGDKLEGKAKPDT